MRNTVIILAACLCLAVGASAQKAEKALRKFPSYEEVARHFHENYSKDGDYTTALQFERRPNGWYVSEVKLPYKEVLKKQMFWSVKKRDYLRLKYPSASTESPTLLERQLQNRYKQRGFHEQPYWGYEGWADDVIRAFGKSRKLPDNILYGLGRAYSRKANEVLGAPGDFHQTGPAPDLPEGKNALSPERLAEYLKYNRLACAKFKALREQNPEFETIVGNIHTKYSNEYMTAYMHFLMYQNHADAIRYSKAEGLYDEFMIAAAKNYLESIAPNGILFTYGDNDTYPLWYVQQHLGFRTDVQVLNTSILNTSRFPLATRERIGEAEGVPHSLPAALLRNDDATVLYLENPNAAAVSLRDFLAEAATFQNHDGKGGENIPKMETMGRALYMEGSEGTLVEWKLPKNRRHVTRADMVMLDIIQACAWERPVYFAVSMREYMGLDDYLSLEGLAYRLTPIAKEGEGSALPYLNQGYLDITLLKNKLLRDFEYKGMDKPYEVVIQQYLLLFSRLVEAEWDAGDKSGMLNTLDFWQKTLPDERVPYSLWHLLIAEYYQKAGRRAEAEAVCAKILANAEAGRGAFGEGAPEYLERLKSHVQRETERILGD